MEPNVTTQCRTEARKAAWDTQYETFYAGARFITAGHSFRTFDWQQSCALVDDLLSSYSLEEMLGKLRN
jgi:4-hydroxyphenylacetate 3-monooxygenase